MNESIVAKKTYNLELKSSVNKSQAIGFLKIQRALRNISQQEVADKIGCHLNAINRLETQGTGSDELIERYAKFLGYQLDKSYNFTPSE